MTNRARVKKALREAGKPLSATDIAAADKLGKLTPELAEKVADELIGKGLTELPDGRYEVA